MYDASARAGRYGDKEPLSKEEQLELRALQKSDRDVKAHEAAHRSAAGGSASSGPSYQYKKGPDGQLYAVAGEVRISLPTTTDEPQQTLHKARRVERAALAPVDPSPQDRKVAAEAAVLAARAEAQAAHSDRSPLNIYSASDQPVAKPGALVDTFV